MQATLWRWKQQVSLILLSPSLFPALFHYVLFLEVDPPQIKALNQNLSREQDVKGHVFHTSLVCYDDHVSASDLGRGM